MKETSDIVKNYSITDSKNRIFFFIIIPMEGLNFPTGSIKTMTSPKTFSVFQKPPVSLHSY